MTTPHVLRDRHSLWSIIYNPSQEIPFQRSGEEYVSREIIRARARRIISSQAERKLHEDMESLRIEYLNRAYADLITSSSDVL